MENPQANCSLELAEEESELDELLRETGN